MDPEPSSSVLPTHVIQDRFHDQIRQYGQEIISFVSEELRGPPLGISITLERLEWPEGQVNWVWFVGSADNNTEQAVLRFFRTDAGKRAMISNGPDPIEFKLASTLLRLPASQAEDLVLPAAFTAAVTPLRDDQEAMILSKSPPHPICVSAGTNGWLQVSPHMQFSQVLFLKLQEQTGKYI